MLTPLVLMEIHVFYFPSINALLVLSICAPIQLHLTQQSPMGVVQERISMLTTKRNTLLIGYE